ncbi:MAG: hypothetical protein JXX14_17720 [Deltaproteobacteria bacterium]|nr:hypothetical protein [Deltaproteobacteria bacterium]
MNRMNVPVALIMLSACFAAVGCATPRYTARMTRATNNLTEPAYEIESRQKEIDWDEDLPVTVMINQTPEGVSWNDKGELVIAPGFEGKYLQLGDAMSSHGDSKETAFWRSALFYVNMHERHSKGRDVFCKAQMPFRWAFIGLWMAVPLQWPCYAWQPGDSAEKMQLLEKEIKRVAFAMGGNLVLVRRQESLSTLQGAVLIAR